MSFPDDSTWMVSSGDRGTFALYVRDALGISSPTADAIPPLSPAVPRAGLPVPPGAAADWDRWWTDSFAAGQTSASAGSEQVPAHWPAGLLDQLHIAHSRWSAPAGFEARRYAGTNVGQLISEVVTEVERELGRTAVFRLELIQIPVQGQFWRRLATSTVLVSEELMASRNVLAPLESVIRELAR